MSEYSGHDKAGPSVGIVEKKFFTFAAPPAEMKLQSGASLGPITLAYETYGTLNEAGTNAVLVLHALSGNSHAAGYYTEEDEKPGWWNNMIGPGKAIDTNRYFVLCANIIGSCYGSTGPSSIDPRTGKPYGMRFPMFTMGDVVETQQKLADQLGIPRFLSMIGGSIGGMQGLEWAVRFPEMVASVIPVASTCGRSALAIGLSEAQRQAIVSDPAWNGGDYYGGPIPARGLALARMIGHISYLSEASMDRKFGRRLQEGSSFKYEFGTDFQVESYLHYQGRKFVDRFDANSYLYITKASDYFDLAEQWGGGSLAAAFARASARFLVVSFSSDWLFPTSHSRAMVGAMKRAGRDASFCEIDADFGHDSFLLAHIPLTRLIAAFLARVAREENVALPRGGAR
ncbi:MAG: homoserine O-acetyltransferase MetX [Candidatus Aminicenantales bacterium]